MKSRNVHLRNPRYTHLFIGGDLRAPVHYLRHSAAAEWLLFALLFGVFSATGFLPAWRSLNTDFPNYYVAASLYRQGIAQDRMYEWRWFQRHKDHLQVPEPLATFTPHPPMCALPMLPLAGMSPLAAKRVWLVLNLGFLALGLWFLQPLTALPWRRLLLLCFLCILPLHQNFLRGQYYVFIFFLICLAYFADQRGWRFTSGAVLAFAALLKIFPAFFVILFVRKRNWRSVVGFTIGGAALAGISVLLFGWNVHKIFLLEVLPRSLHGDLLGPYDLRWNSFTALCHKLLLQEPEFNPAPFLDSPATYAIVQSIVATTLLFAFLLFTGDDDTPSNAAWEWATLLPVLLLLSSLPAAYHQCVLVFTIIVGVDLLLKRGRKSSALLLIVFFVIAWFPLPGALGAGLQTRLVGDLSAYILLLSNAPVRASSRDRAIAWALALVFCACLAFSNLRSVRNRSEDFPRRLTPFPVGYATLSAARYEKGVLLEEMTGLGFFAEVLPSRLVHLPVPGDVLSIAAASDSPVVYLEVTGARSNIFRLTSPADSETVSLEEVSEGHDPAVSADGRWLAYVTENPGKNSVHLWKDGTEIPVSSLATIGEVLELSVSNDGDITFSTGSAADPHFATVKRSNGSVLPVTDIHGGVRFPAISPDGKRLAFSRRESGSWHLFVRDLETATERRLTSASCNATVPEWEDSDSLLYVTDCGRGLGLSAPARVALRK